MLLRAKLEEAGQAVATWLLQWPCVQHRFEAGFARMLKEPRPVPDASDSSRGNVVIVVGVRPGGAILGGLSKAGKFGGESDDGAD